jgi:glycerol-3-phosphate dehydrogenase
VHELGQSFGHGLYAQEVDYLVDQEWAITSQDILSRRSKLYLEFKQDDIDLLDAYLLELHERRLQKDVA